jgi:ADP-ribose pyrophosphatase YjhB (NUDIX family)
MSGDGAESLQTRLVGGLIRRLGLLTRAMTLGVRAIVLDGENRVFLVRHTYLPGWYLPGGGVERGEDALTSIARELEEEGNISLAGEPELFGLYAQTGRDHVVVFVVRSFTQSAPKTPDHEIAEAGFFPLDALPEGATRATRARLDELLNGAKKSRRW